jgi:putative peptide zinc metalloprotease protein
VSSSAFSLLGRSAAPRLALAPRPRWPELRQELLLHEGPRLRDGQPSWTLHDPVRDLYFQLDWLTFEVVAHWTLGGATAIADAVSAETTLQATVDDVQAVAKFLRMNQLIAVPGANCSADLAAIKARTRHALWKRVLHNYLFFRIPLVHPDALLSALYRDVRFLFTAGFVRLTVIAMCAGLVLVYREWDTFRTTLVGSMTYAGALAYVGALVVVKICHELGHGLTAKRYGCRVPTMGIAFLVLWPMPYTDTNEAWKLTSRTQRLHIGAAGVVTELAIAAWATLAWSLLPGGMLRTCAFLLATTTWVHTVAVNCSPFMRFDGYFVLSDFLEAPNLHARAGALARWRLREWLFALGDPPPEAMRSGRRAFLIFFAYLTWCYRLVVFLGIAFLVYSFFIKAVGMVLFAVEIVWFVLMPIYLEAKAWRSLWPRIRASGRSYVTFLLVLLLVAAAFYPLPGRIKASGLLHPGEEFPVHAVQAGQLEALYVQDGAYVRAGTPLLRMSAEQLDQRLKTALSRVRRYDQELAVSAFNPEQRAKLLVRQGELHTAQVARRGLESEKQEFEPVAEVAGQFRLHDPDVSPGSWIARNEQLGTVVSRDGWHAECYVTEDAVHRVHVGDTARFYADGHTGEVVAMRVSAVDQDATHVLDQPLLAVQHGGTVEARETEGRLVPEKGAYRVTFAVLDAQQELAAHTWRGTVVISGAAESIAAQFQRAALSLLWREAGW